VLSYDDVRKILMLIEDSTLAEIHVEFGDFKLDARRLDAVSSASPAKTENTPVHAPSPPAAASVPASRGAALREGQFALAAPMLGTFYRAPAPDALPFVDVGTHVAANDPLCIIEVMKLMNTIKAERPGRVAAFLAENATLVEFGQTLIVFDPL